MAKLSLTAARDFERDLDALGARRLDPDELCAVRTRFRRVRFVSTDFELGRLRVRLATLRDIGLIAGCRKAIAELALCSPEKSAGQ